jgi:hypothetical protein
MVFRTTGRWRVLWSDTLSSIRVRRPRHIHARQAVVARPARRRRLASNRSRTGISQLRLCGDTTAQGVAPSVSAYSGAADGYPVDIPLARRRCRAQFRRGGHALPRCRHDILAVLPTEAPLEEELGRASGNDISKHLLCIWGIWRRAWTTMYTCHRRSPRRPADCAKYSAEEAGCSTFPLANFCQSPKASKLDGCPTK